jgi:hypothetical protein
VPIAQYPVSNTSTTRRRLKVGLALALTAIGLGIFVVGIYLETRNPRSNNDDTVACCVLAVGAFLTGMGVSLRFVPTWLSIAIGIASPFVAFALAVTVAWSIIILNAIFRFL